MPAAHPSVARTAALHRLDEGDTIGIRGPFGRGFPVEKFRGKDVLFAPGQAVLNSQRIAELDKVVAALKNKSQRIRIVGHTDSVRVGKATTIALLKQWLDVVEVDGGVDASRAGSSE